MNLVVCLKEVASRDTRYRVAEDARWIAEKDVSYEINECDEYALEEALKLQEKHGGEVTLLTLGKGRADKSIRKGLAMGAHRAIQIVDDEARADSPFAIASALSRALQDEEFDLILAGTQSDDLSYAQVGVILAQQLGLPHATIVMEIDADPDASRLKALREMESGWFQWVQMPLPAVLTIQAGISKVRYPSLKGIMQAKRKEIRRLDLADLSIDWDSIPRVEVRRLYFPEASSKAEMLEGDPATVAADLVEKLKKEARVL